MVSSNKDRCNGDDAQCHADAVTAHALLARPKIAGVAVVAIIATAVASAVRNFPWASTAQLGLALDLYAIADDRHNTTQMALLLTLAGRSVLHDEILFRSGNVVLIRPMIYLRPLPANPSAGAGEFSVHSSVLHSQGFASAAGPRRMLQNKFTRKMILSGNSDDGGQLSQIFATAPSPLHIVRRLDSE